MTGDDAALDAISGYLLFNTVVFLLRHQTSRSQLTMQGEAKEVASLLTATHSPAQRPHVGLALGGKLRSFCVLLPAVGSAVRNTALERALLRRLRRHHLVHALADALANLGDDARGGEREG